MSQAFDFQKFKLDFVTELNGLRQDHGAPSLTFADHLEAGAFEKAKILLGDENTNNLLDVRGTNDIVIQLNTNMEIKSTFFISNFKDQKNSYDFGVSKYVEKAGAFTQAVWVNTKQVSIGYACQDEKYIFLFRFYPYGNIEGRFYENVHPHGSPLVQRTDDGPIPLKSLPTPHELETVFTKYHNTIRNKYGCDPLVWNADIAKEALKAAELILDSKINNSSIPKTNDDYGKNVAFCMSGIPSMDTIMSRWYDTRKNFSYDTYECNESNGSFVQIVYKNITRFGVAACQKNNYCVYVAYYHPRLIITEKFNQEFPKIINSDPIEFTENS